MKRLRGWEGAKWAGIRVATNPILNCETEKNGPNQNESDIFKPMMELHRFELLGAVRLLR